MNKTPLMIVSILGLVSNTFCAEKQTALPPSPSKGILLNADAPKKSTLLSFAEPLLSRSFSVPTSSLPAVVEGVEPNSPEQIASLQNPSRERSRTLIPSDTRTLEHAAIAMATSVDKRMRAISLPPEWNLDQRSAEALKERIRSLNLTDTPEAYTLLANTSATRRAQCLKLNVSQERLFIATSSSESLSGAESLSRRGSIKEKGSIKDLSSSRTTTPSHTSAGTSSSTASPSRIQSFSKKEQSYSSSSSSSKEGL